jgi:hypothetical protein
MAKSKKKKEKSKTGKIHSPVADLEGAQGVCPHPHPFPPKFTIK